MYIAYYDEAGDDGYPGSSQLFVLSALYLHYSDWKEVYQNIQSLRQSLRNQYGLPIKMEFHTRHFLANKKPFMTLNISDNDRANIVDELCEFISFQPLKIINVVINKQKIKLPSYQILNNAFKYSIQRIENDLGRISPEKRFMIITDPGREIKMRRTSRMIQRINIIPSKYGQTGYRSEIRTLIEDPLPKASDQSYFIQFSDVAATIVYMYCVTYLAVGNLPKRLPTGINHKKIIEWMDCIKPVLNLDASTLDQYGLVIYPT